jgi:membrane-associated phospholipid phosphatase
MIIRILCSIFQTHTACLKNGGASLHRTQAAFQQPANPWRWLVPLASVLAMAAIVITGSNRTLFLWINKQGLFADDVTWAAITMLGDGWLAMILLLPLAGRRPDILWAAMVAGLLSTLLVLSLKLALGVARPPAVLSPESFHLIGPALKATAFPSGHTATIFAWAGVVALGFKNGWLGAGLLLIAAAVGLSRIMVGVHWPLDVLGGALLGWMSAVWAIELARRWPRGMGVATQRLIAAVLALAALYLLLWPVTSYADTQVLQRVIALSCLMLALPGLIRLFVASHG